MNTYTNIPLHELSELSGTYLCRILEHKKKNPSSNITEAIKNFEIMHKFEAVYTCVVYGYEGRLNILELENSTLKSELMAAIKKLDEHQKEIKKLQEIIENIT